MRVLTLAVVALVLTACGDEPSADPELFCDRLGRLSENDPFLAFGETATPAEIEQGFAALVARADELADVAPDEARPAAETYAESARAMDELMSDADYVGGRIDARAYRNEQERYTEAADRLLRYLSAECDAD